MKYSRSVAFIFKPEKPYVQECISFLKNLEFNVDEYSGSVGDKFPEKIYINQYDYIISYISPWIIPEAVLSKTKLLNINFHPGPPNYPGIGAFNFALINKETSFGATAHIMNTKVDTGKIIDVIRFPINDSFNVNDIAKKTYQSLYELFKIVLLKLNDDANIEYANHQWTKEPFTRKQLESISELDLNISQDELDEKIRVLYYPNKPAPYITIHGKKFEYNPDR